MLVQTIRNFGTDLFSFNNTEASIKCKVTDNAIFSVGLDDVTKLRKSFDLLIFGWKKRMKAVPDDVNQLRLRLRGNTTFVKQGILTLNPIWAGHWIKKLILMNRKRSNTASQYL